MAKHLFPYGFTKNVWRSKWAILTKLPIRCNPNLPLSIFVSTMYMYKETCLHRLDIIKESIFVGPGEVSNNMIHKFNFCWWMTYTYNGLARMIDQCILIRQTLQACLQNG